MSDITPVIPVASSSVQGPETEPYASNSMNDIEVLPIHQKRYPEGLGHLAIGGDAVLPREATDFYEINSEIMSKYVDKFTGHNKFSDFQKDIDDLELSDDGLPAYELRRMPIGVFIDLLHRTGVISTELFESGQLQSRFAPDQMVVRNGEEHLAGGLRHILLGDIVGGGHDVDTLEDVGIAGPGTDTIYIDPTDKGARRRAVTGATLEQRPDIRFGTGVDSDGDGQSDHVRLSFRHATSQFPENWTTDQVLTAVISASEESPRGMQNNGNFLRTGVIDGVPIIVITNPDGLIVTGYPEYGDLDSAVNTALTGGINNKELVGV